MPDWFHQWLPLISEEQMLAVTKKSPAGRRRGRPRRHRASAGKRSAASARRRPTTISRRTARHPPHSGCNRSVAVQARRAPSGRSGSLHSTTTPTPIWTGDRFGGHLELPERAGERTRPIVSPSAASSGRVRAGGQVSSVSRGRAALGGGKVRAGRPAARFRQSTLQPTARPAAGRGSPCGARTGVRGRHWTRWCWIPDQARRGGGGATGGGGAAGGGGTAGGAGAAGRGELPKVGRPPAPARDRRS